MFIPEKYKNLSKDELINAFFSEYYDLIIAVDDDSIIDSMLDYVRKTNNHLDCDNEIFWKHIWLSYLMYIMQRMKYSYCYDIISREKLRLNETSNETFLRFIAVVNVSAKLLTRGDAVISAPRLLDCILGDSFCSDECGFIFEKKAEIAILTEEYKDIFVFKTNFFNNNKYFDVSFFIINTLTMLHLNSGINEKTMFRCISSILKEYDEMTLMMFCQKLCNIIK